jgi:pSer/pThr/pTyr-binding forkhead associated (FHA) protein
MKVQLIVVQGKPEGKTIPLVGPVFRIGRGETCHLRPNSEQVSREHAEFGVSGDVVTVRDLGSRNGTLVNGKAIAEQCALVDGDLVQVGPLAFAVSIKGAPTPVKKVEAPVAAAKPAPAKVASPDDVSHDDIDSWLVSDNASPTPERPSGVYGGDTITIAAFKDTSKAQPQPEPEPEPEPAKPAKARAADEEIVYDKLDDDGDADGDGDDGSAESSGSGDDGPQDFIDESNPFYVKKKEPEAPAKPAYKDTSDAASEILRKLKQMKNAK